MKKILLVLLMLFGLQAQTQINWCDSAGYSTQSNGGNIIVNGYTASQPPGMAIWNWQVCNTSLCFSGTGSTVVFNQITPTDTLKVCYDLLININGFTQACSWCDSLVYDPNQHNWVPMVHPLGIEEFKNTTITDNKTYDLLGREIFEIPKGTIYIKNRKKFIR